MNKSVKQSLKKQSKFRKIYQNNLSSFTRVARLNQARKFMVLITEAEERYITKISTSNSVKQ